MKRNLLFSEYNENKRQKKEEYDIGEYDIDKVSKKTLFYILLCLKQKFKLYLGELLSNEILKQIIQQHCLKLTEKSYPNFLDILDIFRKILKKNPSEQIKMFIIIKNPFLIANIKNPSEKIQLEAVRIQPGSICFIKKPNEKVQLKAISRFPDSSILIKPNGYASIIPSNDRIFFFPNPKNK